MSTDQLSLDGIEPPQYRPLPRHKIRGVYNPNRKCNDDCTHARREYCECSCGGRNHGIYRT